MVAFIAITITATSSNPVVRVSEENSSILAKAFNILLQLFVQIQINLQTSSDPSAPATIQALGTAIQELKNLVNGTGSDKPLCETLGITGLCGALQSALSILEPFINTLKGLLVGLSGSLSLGSVILNILVGLLELVLQLLKQLLGISIIPLPLPIGQIPGVSV